MLTEKPVVCFLPGETGAVDTALLPGANADGLAVLHIADRIGLGIFKRDKCNDHIPHGRIRERFVFRHEILQQRSIDAEVVVSLLKGDTEDILAFLQSGHVIGINLDDVVVALFLRFQDLQGFFRICRGDNAVGDFFLQVECGGSVAGITQGCPIPIGTQAVGTAGTDVRTGDRRELCIRSDKVDLSVDFTQRQADCRTGRGDMLKAGCAGKAGCFLEFLNQLPGIQCIQEVDVSGTAVEHLDREFRPILHIDACGFLIWVAAVFQFKCFHHSVPQMFVEQSDISVDVCIERNLIVIV